MKFKEVEISAFRIFDKPEDATFNFSTESGEIANFISLYAPNGFGKTSFYDAVEWGMTNNIKRFWQNKEITNNSIDALKSISDKQIKLWRNTNSSIPTYVKITTDANELSKRDLNVHGNSKIDTTNPDHVVNKEFRQVILSQEWISAFLKEVNGEYRYDLFMENPDLKEINNYFKGLKSLFKTCYEKISNLEDNIKTEKEKIKDIGDKNLLEVINNQITLINEKSNESGLILLGIDSTKEDIKKLKDLISKRIVDSNRVSILMKVLDVTKIAKVGDENKIGIKLYYEYIQQLNETNEKKINIKSFLKKFDDLEKYENELSNYIKKELELRDNKKKVDVLIDQFDEYIMIKNGILQKQDSIRNIVKELPDLTKQYEEFTTLQISYKTQLDTITKKIEDNNIKLAEIPHLQENVEKIKTELKSLEDFFVKEKGDSEKFEIEIKKYEDRIGEILNHKEEVNRGEYHLFIDDCNNDEISNLKKMLVQKNKIKLSEHLKKEEISTKIEQQQELNSTIQEFIKSGLTIVNERQTSVCPLCEQVYDSYSILAERISNNKALSNILQELMQENNVITQNISVLLDEINDGTEELIKHYDTKLDTLNFWKKEIENQFEVLNKSINENLIRIEQLKSSHTHISIQMNGLSTVEYENQIRKNINESEKQRDEILRINSDLNEKIILVNEQININKGQIIIIDKEIEDLVKNEKYILITDWFSTNYPDNAIELEILTNMLKSLILEISELNEKASTIKIISKSTKSELISLNKDNLLIQEKECDIKKNDLESKIEGYKHFIKENIDIEVGQMSKEELSEILNSKETVFKSELKKVKELHEEYERLEKYSENIFDFLQSEKAKQELINKEKELSFLKEKVTPLIETENDRTQQYLEKKVREFFYEDLINDLYKKIDPHPDFKSVEFKPDLNAENPSLNVFVRNSNNEEALIPNLYFSTAQINILSLSIFLASALHSKEYDCIFVDDPIQSMDSINVLSTIDLLRSIVVNYGKQIILSTHDENFHNLLKKKIPSNLFRSKFMEFETFGKVKKG